MVSTYRPAILLTSQLDESREAPMKMPNAVAKTIPIRDTLSILRTPTIKARRKELDSSYPMTDSDMGKPASWPRKSKPSERPRLSAAPEYVGNNEC